MHTKRTEFTAPDNPANPVNISTYAHLSKYKANILTINHHKLQLNPKSPKLIWYKKKEHFAKNVDNFCDYIYYIWITFVKYLVLTS